MIALDQESFGQLRIGIDASFFGNFHFDAIRVRELSDVELEPAEYRLEFDTRRYFERSGLGPFYPSVSVVFTFEGGHLHVPLLLSAYGYTTYKGT